MEKQSTISTWQLIVLLIMTRLPFSTAYYVSLSAGRSIQDVLFAVPVNFVLNFIVAIPILILLKRHPGKDLIECADIICGKAAGIIIAIFYMLCFVALSIYIKTIFQEFFVNNVIPEFSYYAIAIPLLIVAFYGAVKGIETIARFSGIVILFYLIILTIITISLVPSINYGYLFPAFYTGPKIFMNAVINGINSNIQIVLLAFCAPFLKAGTKLGKLYTKWNMLAMLLFFGLEFLSIVVLGPFAAKQYFPLIILSMQSRVGVFERIDAFDMISWILNTILMVTFFVYLATNCMLKAGLNKHRKLVAFLIVAVIFGLTQYLPQYFIALHGITLSPYVTVITLTAIILVPILILVTDLIKGRVASNEKEA